MKFKAILFDLDGTLLPMNQDIFISTYFKKLAEFLYPHGYDPNILINNIWKGTSAMLKNDGTVTNEKAFWNYFVSAYGEGVLDDVVLFDEFYRTEFPKIQAVCGYTPQSKQLLNYLHSNNITAILATNPIFPAVATTERIRWAGLTPDDFALITTYENISFSKPNIKYYEDILQRMGLSPEDCLMVGNDVDDDMPAQQLGINVFLLTDCLINQHNMDISQYPHGNFNDLLNFL